MILQQKTHIWMPINLGRPWAHDPLDPVILESFKILKHVKHMIGIVVAVILSLITVTTTAAVSGIALHTTIQTKHFVEQWHQDSYTMWSHQVEIDSRLQTEIDVLKQMVGWLGKKMLSLQEQLHLRCDWNSASFCITELQYDETVIEYKEIQAYLHSPLAKFLSGSTSNPPSCPLTQ